VQLHHTAGGEEDAVEKPGGGPLALGVGAAAGEFVGEGVDRGDARNAPGWGDWEGLVAKRVVPALFGVGREASQHVGEGIGRGGARNAPGWGKKDL
jgi:hypothetical protein